MRIRNLLLLSAILLVTSAPALAQRTPPTPGTPPSPSITVPVPPDAPVAFSFSSEGSYLGVSPENIGKENMSEYGLSSPRGVGISSVSQGSPAERAGLKKGDVILQFDGEPVTSSRKLLRLIGEAAPEQTVRLTISRNNSEQQVSVTLGQREDASRAYRTLVTPGGMRGELFRTPRVPQIWNDSPGGFAFGLGSGRRVGVITTPLTKQLADFFGVSGGQGLLITSISDNSPASKAGLRAGDVITEMNGEKLDSADDFVRALNRKDEGKVTLTIIRDKSQRTIKVTPERRPAPAFNLSELMPAQGIGQMIPPVYRMDMPQLRDLQTVPKIDSLVLPKIDGSMLPRLMNIPPTRQLLPAQRIL
jgi:serine protease Do